MKRFLQRFFDAHFWKFMLVGIINTAIGNGIGYFLLNVTDCSYELSSAVNLVTGSVVSYFLNKHYTFRSKKHSFGEVFRFTLIIAVCYLLSYLGLARYLTDLIFYSASEKGKENIAMLIGLALFSIFNYIGQRFFAFRRKDGE